MSALGSPQAAERIRRADGMKCAAHSTTTHEMGYNNYYYYNPESGSEIYPLVSSPNKS